MAIILGSQGISATPTLAFHGDGTGTGILDTALIAAGWVFVEKTTVAEQGTLGDNYVWRDASTRFYVAIECDDSSSGDSLKFRAAESYDTATNLFNQPVSGHSSTTSVAATTNGTVSDTAKTINNSGYTPAEMGWVNTRCSRAGFGYLINVNADRLTVSIQSDAAVVSNQSTMGTNWMMVGYFAPLFDTIVDSRPLFLAGSMSQATVQVANGLTNGTSWATSSASTSSNLRTSRSLANGILSATGGFTHCIDFPQPSKLQNGTAPNDTDYGVIGTLSRAPGGYRAGLCGLATIHGQVSAGVYGQRSFRGYIPKAIVFLTDNVLGTGIIQPGLSILVNSTVYYYVGHVVTNTVSGQLGALAFPMALAIASG